MNNIKELKIMKTKFDLIFEEIMASVGVGNPMFDSYEELEDYTARIYPEHYKDILETEKAWYKNKDGKFELDKIKADYMNMEYDEDPKFSKRRASDIDDAKDDFSEKEYKLSPQEEYESFKEVEKTWSH
jgi:hypothetical protein